MNKKTSLQLLLTGICSLGVLNAQAGLIQGPSSSTASYLDITNSTVSAITAILTAGDTVNKAGGGSYTMAGVPDGLGAYDNGDGTFTVLMNHELTPTYGISTNAGGAAPMNPIIDGNGYTTATRDHGGWGAFVSEWVINKNNFSVVSGHDLIQTVKNYDTNSSSWVTITDPTQKTFSRLCSADLAAPSAFYNAATGKGTTERIFLNGDEDSTTLYRNAANGTNSVSRGLATVVTGSDKGTTYVLPAFTQAASKVGWENLLANPNTGDKTVVIGNSDGGKNGVFLYIGDKQTNGNAIEKAGLTGGTIYRVAVNTNAASTETLSSSNGYGLGLTSGSGLVKATGNFSLLDVADTNSSSGTTFLRPEDGAWDINNTGKYYFVTTSSALPSGRSRLWSLTFSDTTHFENGGTLSMLLDGTEGQNMFDNMTVDKDGNIILCEDIGNNAAIGKMWKYDVITGSLTSIMTFNSQFDPANKNNPGYQSQDEETSGVLDITDILNKGDGSRYYLFDAQDHVASTNPALMEGGQLLVAQAVPEPSTYALMGLGALALILVASRRKNA